MSGIIGGTAQNLNVRNNVYDDDPGVLAWVPEKQGLVVTDTVVVNPDVSDRAARLLGVVSDYAPALKVYESGTVLYVCTAAPGSILTNAVWRIMKVDTTTGVIITWCDGNSNYDNLATSLAVVAALSYS